MVVKELDCLTATLADVSGVYAPFRSVLRESDSTICGFAGWFDVHFRVGFILLCLLLRYLFQ